MRQATPDTGIKSEAILYATQNKGYPADVQKDARIIKALG
jgi:hypothetical protein